jgi:hypothetical protein
LWLVAGYLLVLERKPGALRNGAAFKHWDLPQALGRIGEHVQGRYADWKRQYVGILQAAPLYRVEAVEAACGKALGMGPSERVWCLTCKLRGMQEAYDEVISSGRKQRAIPEKMILELLKAKAAERRLRSSATIGVRPASS